MSGDHVEQGGGTQLGPPLVIVHQLHDLVGDHLSGDHVEQAGGTQHGPPLVIVHLLHDLVWVRRMEIMLDD